MTLILKIDRIKYCVGGRARDAPRAAASSRQRCRAAPAPRPRHGTSVCEHDTLTTIHYSGLQNYRKSFNYINR